MTVPGGYGTVDFPALLYALLPGIYRDKDRTAALRRFLQLAATPLAETEESIGRMYDDLYLDTAREEFVGLIGGLVGATTDPTLPVRAQRVDVEEAIASYRVKGIRTSLQSLVERMSELRVILVDYSERMAQTPFVDTLDPVVPHVGAPVSETAPGSGNFFFSGDGQLQPLFDRRLGRPITRSELAGHETEYADVRDRFSIKLLGSPVFTPTGAAQYQATAANLADFNQPKTPGGAALVIPAGTVAIDPELGRFKIVSPVPLTADVSVDFQALVPASIPVETFDVGDPLRMRQLGRSDDPAPRTADLRASRRTTDGLGRHHFDNLGLFFTFGRRIRFERPNVLPPGSQSGWFTFDGTALAAGNVAGIPLQLLDGLDGSPITRMKLAGHEREFCGTPRGFSILVRRIDICDPAFTPSVTLRAADLSDFAQPKTASGAGLTLGPADVAVDPQLGRFLVNLTGLGATAEQFRVDYLLGPAEPVLDRRAVPVVSTVPELLAVDADRVALRDGSDGTPIAIKLRLGSSLADFHDLARGWVIKQNGANLSGGLTPVLQALESLTTPVAVGTVAVDPDRGRFKCPAGLVTLADRITIDCHLEPRAAETQVLTSVAQRLSRLLPAGVVPVSIDSRQEFVDPAGVQ